MRYFSFLCLNFYTSYIPFCCCCWWTTGTAVLNWCEWLSFYKQRIHVSIDNTGHNMWKRRGGRILIFFIASFICLAFVSFLALYFAIVFFVPSFSYQMFFWFLSPPTVVAFLLLPFLFLFFLDGVPIPILPITPFDPDGTGSDPGLILFPHRFGTFQGL